MKLTKVAASFFMGGTFSVQLGDLNIVHGTNDSGKTRLGNLIKLLLLGYLPTLGKQPGEIFKLSSGAEMVVEGMLDKESIPSTIIKRRWKQAGESVRTEKWVPLEFEGRTPLVLLDANDYFGRTARGRVEMVFAVANLATFDAREIARKLPKELLEQNQYSESGATRTNPQEFLESALQFVEEARKTAAADVKRYTGTLQGLSELQLADKPATRSVEEIDTDIQAEQNAVAEKRARRTALDEAQGKNEQRELERADLQHRIEQAGDPIPREFDINALRIKEKELGVKLNAENAKALAHKLWQDALDHRVEETARLLKELSAIEAERFVDLGPPLPCGECGRPYANTKKERQKQFTSGQEGRVSQKRKQIADSEKPPLPPAPPTGSESEIAVIDAELRQVQDDISEFVATADVQAWRKQLAEMVKPVDHSEAITLLQAEAHRHAERVTTLQNERKAAESDRQDRKRLAEAQGAQEAAITAETRYKEAKAFLLEKKAQLIETVFGPLLDTAARFMHGIFPPRVEYRDGELGMFVGNSWVTEATFGGAKRALLHAALQCALGSQSPCRIILMDELSVIDAENLTKLLINVEQASNAGLFDQFVGMTARPCGAPLGFTVIEAADNTYTTE